MDCNPGPETLLKIECVGFGEESDFEHLSRRPDKGCPDYQITHPPEFDDEEFGFQANAGTIVLTCWLSLEAGTRMEQTGRSLFDSSDRFRDRFFRHPAVQAHVQCHQPYETNHVRIQRSEN